MLVCGRKNKATNIAVPINIKMIDHIEIVKIVHQTPNFWTALL
jgi:hypothetical protein